MSGKTALHKFIDALDTEIVDHLSTDLGIPEDKLRTSIDKYFSNILRITGYEEQTVSPGAAKQGSPKQTKTPPNEGTTKELSGPTQSVGCEYVKKTTARSQGGVCGKKSSLQLDGKWYCGNKREDGTFTGHMGDMSKRAERETATKLKKTVKRSLDLGESDTQKVTGNDSNSKPARVGQTQVKSDTPPVITKVRQTSQLPKDKLPVSKYTTPNGEYYFYNQQTGIVFNPLTRKAYACVDEKFKLHPLTEENKKFLDKRGDAYDDTYFDEPVADSSEVSEDEDSEEEVGSDESGDDSDDSEVDE